MKDLVVFVGNKKAGVPNLSKIPCNGGKGDRKAVEVPSN